VTTLLIKTLGQFAVRRNGVGVPLPPSRKTRALLAYLVVTGRPQRREHLCELFWDVPDDPKGALRWSLSKLRPIVTIDGQPLLIADRASVQLHPSDRLDVDYSLFRGLSPDAVGDLSDERLEVLVKAFEPGFAADLALPRCPEYEAWRTANEHEIEVLVLRVLRTLIGRLAAEPQRALSYAHTLQALLPEEDLSREIARLAEQARVSAAAPMSPVDRDTRRAALRLDTGTSAGPVAAVDTRGGIGTMRDDSRPLAPAPPPRKFQQTVRFCKARDGARIAYALSGAGPAVVRAAHWMSHLEYDAQSPVWGHWMSALTDGYSLVRYDERLNGLSATDIDDVSFEAFVNDLEAVVDAAGLQRFVLLGISQGCALSVEYAVRHPQRVAGLVLYGGYVRGWRVRGDPSELARREAMTVLIREGWGSHDPAFRQLFTNLFIPDANQEQMDWFNELQRRTVTPENAWRLSMAFADIDVTERLAQVRVPTLVLHARGDLLTPMKNGLEFAEKIPGARFVELDSDNHILLADEPAFGSFVAAFRAFSDEVLSTSAPFSREPREATLLCADFISPVQAFSQFDPTTPLDIIDPLMLEAVEQVRAASGTIIGLTDTRFTASFGAHEPRVDHAAAACRAALELRTLVQRQASPVRVRIALDTGPVVVAPARLPGSSTDAVEVRGEPITSVQALNRALRRDLVVATDRTYDAAEGHVRMQPADDTAVARFSRRRRLYEVVSA
jgi:pimeloyl-ACP methyl ester carboxylesterase/DNA-binding SARP family transcriptional activator/class 3 adenylate cyclase